MKDLKKALSSAKTALQKRPSAVIRAALQILFFVLAPGLFTSAFGGVKAIASAVGKGQAITLSAHITTLLLLLGFTLLFGRVFCGSACAFGAFGDLVYFLAAPLRKRLPAEKRALALPQGLRFLKYAVLAFIFALCAAGGQSSIRGNSPWDAFAQLISGHISLSGYAVGYILLVLLLFGMAAVPRFFCRFFCPLGAVFSLLPPPLFMRIKKPAAASDSYKACGNCTLCGKSCPAGLKLNAADEITSGECFACFRCADNCWQNKPKPAFFGVSVDVHIAHIALGLGLAALVLVLDL